MQVTFVVKEWKGILDVTLIWGGTQCTSFDGTSQSHMKAIEKHLDCDFVNLST